MPLTRDEVRLLGRLNGKMFKEIVSPLQARIEVLETKLAEQTRTIETLQRQLKLPISVPPAHRLQPGENAS